MRKLLLILGGFFALGIALLFVLIVFLDKIDCRLEDTGVLFLSEGLDDNHYCMLYGSSLHGEKSCMIILAEKHGFLKNAELLKRTDEDVYTLNVFVGDRFHIGTYRPREKSISFYGHTYNLAEGCVLLVDPERIQHIPVKPQRILARIPLGRAAGVIRLDLKELAADIAKDHSQVQAFLEGKEQARTLMEGHKSPLK